MFLDESFKYKSARNSMRDDQSEEENNTPTFNPGGLKYNIQDEASFGEEEKEEKQSVSSGAKTAQTAFTEKIRRLL